MSGIFLPSTKSIFLQTRVLPPPPLTDMSANSVIYFVDGSPERHLNPLKQSPAELKNVRTVAHFPLNIAIWNFFWKFV